MRRWTGSVSRADAALAGAFAVAATVEAVVRYHADARLLVLGLGGAVAMTVLLVRRRHPLLAMTVFCVSGAAATAVQVRLDGAADDAFVPIITLIVLAYALGAHGAVRAVVLGAPQPVLLVGLVDVLGDRREEAAGGLVFAAAFVVVLPVLAGRLVRSRRRLAGELRGLEAETERQHEQRLRTARAEESLAVSEVIGETVAAGLHQLLRTQDIEMVEERARRLLATTRDAVVGLSRDPADADVPGPVPLSPAPPRPRWRADDTAVQTWALLFAAALGTGLLVETGSSSGPWPASLGLTAVIVGAVVLMARRPLEGAILAWAAATLMSRSLVPLGGTFSAIGLTVSTPFLACWLCARRLAAGAVAVVLVGAIVGVPMDDPVGALTLTILAAVGGATLRDRARLLTEVRSARAAADLRRREELRIAVLEQRAALGRELHDSVGHALTIVALQAGAARRLREADPAAADGARRTIEHTARQALLDLDRGFEARPGGLEGLLATARSAGMDVSATGPSPPPELAAVLYRILQEALTNALRHAPGASVSVRLEATPAGYSCTIGNPLSTGVPTFPSGGRGLAGMRARVEEIGGTVDWEDDEGGFIVTATFPTRVGSAT